MSVTGEKFRYFVRMKIAILGPTASGKSALAVAVAKRLGGSVINGDPFQALTGLAIGTGQPNASERQGVPHQGYGVLPLSSRPNPAEFGKQVQVWSEAVEYPVLVTGSGLYLRGIWEQLSDLPSVDESIVNRVRILSASLGVPRMHRYLAAVDADRARVLHPNDGSRVLRALALHLATGRKPSSLLTGVIPGIPADWRVLVVQPTRERQRTRVASRIATQITAGWEDEVASLLANGHRGDLEALRPLGYAAWMEDGPTKEMREEMRKAALARIIQETQAYAKRQSTWFRNQTPSAPQWDPDTEGLDTAFVKLGLA